MIKNKQNIIEFIQKRAGNLISRKSILSQLKIKFPELTAAERNKLLKEVYDDTNLTSEDVVAASILNYQNMIERLNEQIKTAESQGLIDSVGRLIEHKRKILIDLQKITGNITSVNEDDLSILDDAWGASK